MSDDESKDDKNKNKSKSNIIDFPRNSESSDSEDSDIDLGIDYTFPSSPKGDTPIIPDIQSIPKDIRKRDDFVNSDILHRSVKEGAGLESVGDLIILEITEELAHLKYERKKLSLEGKNTTGTTVSRINSLRTLADVVSKKLETSKQDTFDLRSPRFQKILSSWLEFVYDSMKKVGYKDKDVDIVFGQIKADMLDWEKKVSEMK